MKQSIIQINGETYINGEKVNLPNNKRHNSVTQINNKVYVNGYELKNGKWERTLKALFHKIF